MTKYEIDGGDAVIACATRRASQEKKASGRRGERKLYVHTYLYIPSSYRTFILDPALPRIVTAFFLRGFLSYRACDGHHGGIPLVVVRPEAAAQPRC